MTTYRLTNYDTGEIFEMPSDSVPNACQRLYRKADGIWRYSGFRATLILTNLGTGLLVAGWSPLDRPLCSAIALPTVHRIARVLHENWEDLTIKDLKRLDDNSYRKAVAAFPKMILDNLVEARQYYGV